jgi:PAS domain S-box-containing protein
LTYFYHSEESDVEMVFNYAVIVAVLTCCAIPMAKAAVTDTTLLLSDAEKNWLSEHPVIRVAPDPYFPPIEWIDTSGTFKGIAADYLHFVETMLDVRFEIVRCTTWDEVLSRARTHEVDLLSAAAQTPNRKEYLSFTDPHLVFPGVIITRKDVKSGIRLEQLKGMKVAIVSGYVWQEMIAREHPDIIIDPVPDMLTGLQKVSFGMVDAMIENVATATWGIEKEGITNLMISGETGYSSRLSFASRKDWPILTSILDKALRSIDVSKKSEFYRKWIHLDSISVYRQPVFWISLFSVLGGALLILLFVFAWNRSLQRLVAQRTEELNAALQAIPDGIYVVDRTLTLTLCNNALGEFLRKNGFEAPKIGKPLAETFPPGETPYLIEELQTVLATGLPMIKEHTVRLNSSSISSIMRRVPIKKPDGTVQFIMTVVQDITGERTMVQKLRESEHKFIEMVENANSIILCMDRSGTVTFFNRFAEQFFGFTGKEIIGKNVVGTIVPPTDSSGEDLAGKITDIGEHPDRYAANENENIRKDGSRVWIAWTNKPIYNLDGKFLELLCVGNDITPLKNAVTESQSARRRADEAFTEAQKRYRFLFEESPGGALILDGNGIITDISRSLADGLGYPREEVIGKSADYFVIEKEREEQIARLTRRFRNEQTEQVEVRVRAKGGGIRTILFSAGQAVLLEDGKPSSVLVTGIDITERKAAEALARQREQELVRTDKMASLGTLVSGVAHEINNPNNYIILNADNLRDVWRDAAELLDGLHGSGNTFTLAGIPYGEVREEIPRLIDGISEGAGRIKNIVQNLKDFVRPESPSLDQEVNLNRVVDAATVILGNLIRKSTDRCTVTLDPRLPPIRGNFQKIEQVVINLLSNACQALDHRDRAIEIVTSSGASNVTLEITDEGCGISPEVLAHVFDPFYTTKRDSGGTGLGLSISYSIVNEHHGALSLSSTPGERTTARLVFPLPEQPSTAKGSYEC